MNLTEWLDKFCPVNIYTGGRFTDRVKSVYPYIEIDLYRAWEEKRYQGARDVIEYAKFLLWYSYVVIYDSVNETEFGILPAGFEAIRVDDIYHMRSGYERLTWAGKFRFDLDGVSFTVEGEVTWHRHDGYGCNAGDIQFIAACWSY